MAENIVALLRAGKIASVKSFLKANPKAATPQAITEAGRLGWKEAFEALVAHGGNLNASFRGYRALHALIQEEPHAENGRPTPQRLDCLRWLLDHGADPNLFAAWPSCRALIIAAFVGEPLFVDELLKAGAAQNIFTYSALGDAAQVKKLLKKDPSLAQARDEDGVTALQSAAGSRMGKSDSKIARSLLAIALSLIDASADVNAETKSWSNFVNVTYFAVSSGQKELFEMLLNQGANPTAAFPATVWKKRFDFAELALKHGADPNASVDDGKPTLNQLVRWGQFEQALWLLSRNANPNIPDERGWTAMHQASSRGNERMMKALMEAGGDPAMQDNSGHTPLLIARAHGREKLVELLSGES